MACPNRVEKPDQDQDVSGHFVDVLDKLRLIVEHSLSMPSVTDSLGITIDRFRLQSLYQGLEFWIRNSRKDPNLGKLVEVAQAEIQKTKAIDKPEGNCWTELNHSR